MNVRRVVCDFIKYRSLECLPPSPSSFPNNVHRNIPFAHSLKHLSMASSELTIKQCFDSTGLIPEGNIPCDPYAEDSACCSTGSQCVDNLHCIDSFGDSVPGTCTFSSWVSGVQPACPCPPVYHENQTLNYRDGVTFCQDGGYCYGASNFACCDKGESKAIVKYGLAGDTIPATTSGNADEILSTYYHGLAVSTQSISRTTTSISTSSSETSTGLVTISSATSTETASASHPQSLSTGAKAGIGVGVSAAALVVAIVFCACFMMRRRRRQKDLTTLQDATAEQPLHEHKPELSAATMTSEESSSCERDGLVTRSYELHGTTKKLFEKDGTTKNPYEVDVTDRRPR